MASPLHVIHIEDSSADSELMEHMLRDDGLNCEVKRIETREELVQALKGSVPDIIVSDCTLPNFSGLEALEIARAIKPEVPFIFFSGTIGEETRFSRCRRARLTTYSSTGWDAWYLLCGAP